MKFLVSKEALGPVVKIGSVALGASCKDEIVNSFLFEVAEGVCVVHSTDKINYSFLKFPVATDESFKFTINGKKLIEAFNLIDEGELEFDFDQANNVLSLIKGKATVSFSTFPVENFPRKEIDTDAMAKIADLEIKSLVKSLVFSRAFMCEDEKTPDLMLIQSRGGAVVSGDGRMLGMYTSPNMTADFKIRTSSISGVIKFLKEVSTETVSLYEQDSFLFFSQSGNQIFGFRKGEKDFPPIEKMINLEEGDQFRVDKTWLERNIKLVKLGLDVDNLKMKFKVFGEGQQAQLYNTVLASTGKTSESTMSVLREDGKKDIEFSVNFEKVLDVITLFETSVIDVRICATKNHIKLIEETELGTFVGVLPMMPL